MKRKLAYLLMALIALFSCTREENGRPVEYGGEVSLRFATGNLQTTKAETPGNGSVPDGGGLYLDGSGNPDLVILIADNNAGSATRGNIVITYPGPNATKTSSSATESVITFNFTAASLPAGNYMVYAFGNTEGLWPMTTDPDYTGTPSDPSKEISGAGLTALTTMDAVEALRFVPQEHLTIGWEDAGYNGEWDDGVSVLESRLPVSAKAPLTVSSRRNGEARLELIRCVAKVTAKILNNIDDEILLYDYKHTVHDINPTTGYVIPHEEDFIGSAGNLLANPCSKYSSLYPGTYPTPDDVPPIEIAADTGSEEYNWYVFPSEGPFSICIQFTLFKGNVGGMERTYTYNHLPVTNWRAEDIVNLKRNQHLTVETRISQGVQVSFNFEVAEWVTHTASVTFD